MNLFVTCSIAASVLLAVFLLGLPLWLAALNAVDRLIGAHMERTVWAGVHPDTIPAADRAPVPIPRAFLQATRAHRTLAGAR